MLEIFEVEFKGKYESMNPMDSSTYYYCFTKLGWKGDGTFYKYLQKSVSKTIRAFEGPHLGLMFYEFDNENIRLNKGVQGRLIEHCKYLMRENLLKGFDANAIYKYTKKLKYEKPTYHDYVVDLRQKEQASSDDTEKYEYHDFNIQLRSYLEKHRYFT